MMKKRTRLAVMSRVTKLMKIYLCCTLVFAQLSGAQVPLLV